MRRRFVVGVFLFGLVAATAFAAYARATTDMGWPTVLKIWLILVGALSLFPLWTGWTQGSPEGPAHHLFVRKETPDPGEGAGPGGIRPRGPA